MIQLADNPSEATGGGTPILWLAVLVVGLAFFATEHDLHKSRLDWDAVSADDLGLAMTGGDFSRRVAFSSIGLLGIFCLLRRTGSSLSARNPLAMLVLLIIAMCFASVLWSCDQSQTVRRLVVLTFCFLGTLGISRQLTPRELCLMVLILTTAYMAIGLCAEVALGTFRPWASGYRFTGTVHPNTQGGYCGLMCLSAACMTGGARRRKGLFLALAAIAFLCVFLTKSRTGVAAVVGALVALWWLNASARARVLSVTAVAWTLCALLLVGGLFGIAIEQDLGNVVLLGRTEKAASLTGRIPLWTELLDYVAERPLLGYGYECFWDAERIADVSSTQEWAIHTAHSAYVDSLLALGLVGAALLVLLAVVGIRRALLSHAESQVSGYGFLFALLIVFTLVDGFLASAPVQVMFISFVVACGIVHLAFCPQHDHPREFAIQ